MEISYYSAIFLVILTSFMWGFWHRFVKRLGTWPLAAFMIWMFGVGLLVVWVGIFALKGALIPEGIMVALKRSPMLCGLVPLCGAGFAIGMQLQLYVVSKMGLIYSTSVVSTATIILGTILSSILGGIPADTSFVRIAAGAFILLMATLLCQWAGMVRDKARNVSSEKIKKTNRKFLLILGCYLLFFSQSYTIGMSLGIRTDLNPNGIPGVLCVGLLAIGAFVAMLILSGAMLIKNKQLSMLFKPPEKILLIYAVIAGICCLGGDFIHSLASPVVSVAIAWPLGNLSGLWQYSWGIMGGEFKGAKMQAKVMLGVGMCLYIIGIIWFTFARYVR